MMYVHGTKIDWMKKHLVHSLKYPIPTQQRHVAVENLWCLMDTAFVIGNGEIKKIFPIEDLKDKGMIYGCNAIYRDHPMLCDHIVAVNPPMYEELAKWHNNGKESPNIHGLEDISKWNYICDGDHETDVPHGLKIYRMWSGGDIKKGGKIKTNRFLKARGSGCSAVLMAAESGIKNIVIMAFDIMGAQQWEMDTTQQDTEQHLQEFNKLPRHGTA